MSGSIIWKLLLSVAILAWSISSLIPPTDTPFPDYVAEHATLNTAEFESLMERAVAAVEANDYPSVFIALQQIADREGVDLAQFFPRYDDMRVKGLPERNDIVVRNLLADSRGKIKPGLDLQGGIGVTFEIAEQSLEGLQDWEKQLLLEEAVRVIRDRVDSFGVAEPLIRPVGNNGIEVQLPGESTQNNPDILDTISKPAKLTFHRVARNDEGLNPNDLPPRYVAKEIEYPDEETGGTYTVPIIIERRPLATGEIVANSRPQQSPSGQWSVSLSFTDEGAKVFANITRMLAEEGTANDLGRLAIALDGEVYSAPTVREEIFGGAEISGGSIDRVEAVQLSKVLNNPLAVEMDVAEVYEVQATLAADAREASINAGLLGATLVVIFMVVYYFFGGIVAIFSAIANVTIVIGVLASLGATLTLPGVAALVLTLGMGVDANILIFERIREELKAGKKLRSAVIGGFDKAFSTIIDANVTTLLTAIILIWFGTGPVKGFGFTLAIGICASVFSALIITRALFEIVLEYNLFQKVLGLKGLGIQGVDFMKFRRPAFAASWLMVLIGVLATWLHWDQIWGIDFTGGDQVTITAEEPISSGEIENFVRDQGLGEVDAVYQTDIGTGERYLKLQTELDQGRAIFAALQEAYPEAGFEAQSFTQIGAAVSQTIQLNALISVALALIGILLYVAFRFEVGFGIGAVVATIHDVLMTIGLFVALGEFFNIGSGQFTAPMLAAILMIVGYSINDTIVVFDRIREELLLNPGMKLYQVINFSVNRVLNRTILTSITTLLAAVSLYIFGAGIITDFALVFILGILTGTFSSVFIASPVFFWWHKGDRKHVEEREILPKYEWDASSQAPASK
ncbi:MAG: protein translocase subunit SecD [Verrucomicrobiota bacterium]